MQKNETAQAVDRSVRANDLIYKYLPEREVAKLSDEEFLKLREKMRNPSISGEYATLYDFKHGAHPDALNGDETDLHLFKRAAAADIFASEVIYRYSCLFKLCHDLEIANLYDIGCGSQLQAFLLATLASPDMTYTGVDPGIFRDYLDGFEADVNTINGKFYEFTCSDRITFIQKEYPCELDIQPGNIGIFYYALMCRDEERIRKLASSIERDFERAVFTIIREEFVWNGKDIHDIVKKNAVIWENPYEKHLAVWKKALPDYRFYKIGEPNVVFCTKNPVDIKRLERKYTVQDGCVLTTPISMSWKMALMKF